MPRTARLALPLLATLAVAALSLQGCGGGKKAETPPAISPKVSELPAEVPDYVLTSDANVVSRKEDDGLLRVEMTTINGITSPVAYYRKTLPEKGWRITDDNVGSNGGTIRATRRGKNLSIVFSLDAGLTKYVITLEK